MKLLNWLEQQIDLSDVQSAETIIGEIEKRFSCKALAFLIGTSYITETLCKCEIKHFVNGVETKDKWYYLLNVSPNTNENAFKLKQKFINKALYEGESLMFEHKGSLYVADSFQREKRPIKGDLFTNITLDDETKTFTRKADEVFYLNFDDGKLKGLIDSMMNDFVDMMDYSYDIFKSGNSEKYKLILDEIRVGDKTFKENFENVIKKQLESFINNRKAVYPQFKGQNLEKISESTGVTDSTDIREIRKEIFETTAQSLKMPVSMLYGNMTNAKDIVSVFITFAIDPKAEILNQEFTGKTGTMEDYVNGTYFKVDTTSIMHIEIFEIADKIDKLISSSMYCADELRVKVGDSPLNSDFSKQHWITKNYSTVEDALVGETQSVIETASNSVIDVKGGE